jgi:hypothetical protein
VKSEDFFKGFGVAAFQTLDQARFIRPVRARRRKSSSSRRSRRRARWGNDSFPRFGASYLDVFNGGHVDSPVEQFVRPLPGAFDCFEKRGDEWRAVDDTQTISFDRSDFSRRRFIHETDPGHVEDDDCGLLASLAPCGFKVGEGLGRQRSIQAQSQQTVVLSRFSDSQHRFAPLNST